MGETPELKSYDYKIGDLVWAKLKTFCPWPAKVVVAPTNIPKPKKGAHQCVLFFGANNYAYIELHNLKPYKEYKDTLVGASKTASFKDAVAQIEKYIENREKYGEDFDAIENDQDAEFNKLRDAQEPITPKEKTKKAKKESPTKKRASESGVGLGRPPKKSKLSASFSTNDDGLAGSPVGQNHVSRKGYQVVLDRPSILMRPETPPIDAQVSKNISDKNVEPSKLTFGFLGTGNIGAQLVKNLLASGHKMVAWNRTPDKLKPLEELGVKTLQTPQDVVQHADVTFSCVSDPTAAKNIVFGNCGVLKASLANKGYVEMTGIDNETSQDIADAITAGGGRYLEAQLLGNRDQAKNGTLIILTAGDTSLFQDCQSCFRIIGRHSYHLREVGNACKMSLIFNLMSGVAIAGLAEGLALADRCGLELGDVGTILKATRLASPEIVENCNHIINDPYTKNFPLKHMQKYLKLALNMADPMEQSLPLTASSNEVYKHTRRLGYAEFDVSSVYFRERY
ncbi:putative oxidoreductase GLYR1 homolog isoform X2 [Chrysoperla carnea]|uniref:putative oxidoreductase GLYR1 homolog isoform X2 n=1 Tax=Chrysoperla carnea TaxID=189513 RepID=UPI001D07E2B0|nr:putative oxidoreductase GLYR1 homolog isoform X2 [Chrysoperla carnea]